MPRVYTVALTAIACAIATPAAARDTFATFDLKSSGAPQNSTTNIAVTTGNGTAITGYSTRTGTSTSVDYRKAYATNGTPLSDVGLVTFNFAPVATLGSRVDANLFFLGVQSAGTPASVSDFTLGGFTGTLVFKPVGSGAFLNGRTYDPNSVLLAVTFTNGVLTRSKQTNSFGDGTGMPTDSGYNSQEVSFFSDFLTFGNGAPDRSFATSFTGATNSGSGFLASLNGSFDSESLPTASAAPVPELATWGMMIVGFGAIGGTIRRRRPDRARLLLA